MTPKGERTRQRLIDVAMARFEREGFHAATIRKIAGDAEISVGLTYRYFESKEAIVLAFYQQVARELSQRPIEGHTLGARFASVMRHKFALVEGHQRALGSLLGAMLDPDSPVGWLSDATAEVRQTTHQVLHQAVSGADGIPGELVEPLGLLAQLGHGQLLLAWVQRPTAAAGLLDQIAGALDAAVPFLGLPFVGQGLAQAAAALAAFSGVDPPSPAP